MNRRISPSASCGLWPGEDHVGDGDRARIDEGIARNALLVLELHDGVERRCPTARGRRAATAGRPTMPSARVRREHLRDALDRERRLRIAPYRDLAVRVDHAEPELRGIDPRELRDIARNLPAVGPLAHLADNFADDGLEIRHALLA